MEEDKSGEISIAKNLCKFGGCLIRKSNHQSPRRLINTSFEIGSWRMYNFESNKNAIISHQYKGMEFEILINFGKVTIPATGEILDQRGSLTTFSTCGTKPEQDLLLKNLNNSQKLLNEWGLDLGVLDKRAKYYKKFQDIGCPQFATVTAPGIKLADMELYCRTLAIVTIVDDLFDNFKDFWTVELSCLEIAKAVDVFSSILLGEVNDVTLVEDNGFPKYIPMCKLFLGFRNDILQLGYSDEQNYPLFESFVMYLEAVAWEHQGWTDPKEDDPITIKKFYFIMRELTISVIVCTNVICLLKNVHLSPKIRRDPLFQCIQRQFGRQIVLANDIFSLRKEILNNETMNIVLILSRTKTVQHGFNKTIQDLADCMKHIKQLERQLVKKFPNTPELLEYFHILRMWMDGNLQWMFLNKRYGDNQFEICLT